MSERLSRGWRLARARDLDVVGRDGRRRRTPRLEFAWRPNPLGHPRLAIIVARHGHSVVARNRLRRRLREFARRRVLPTLDPVDLIVRSRPAAYRASFTELTADLEQWVHAHSD